MKLISLGIWAWDVGSSALRIKLNSGGQARLELLGGLMAPPGLPGMWSHWYGPKGPRSWEEANFESALGTSEYFWIIAQEGQGKRQDERQGSERAGRTRDWNVHFSRLGYKMTDLGFCFFACRPLFAQTACFSNSGLVILGNADGSYSHRTGSCVIAGLVWISAVPCPPGWALISH